LFNKQSTEQRIDEVSEQIYSLWGGWRPYQTNAFALYKDAGNTWSKIDLSKLAFRDWNESWSDMPKAALDYIQSLPEFDADLFKEITGIDSGKKEKMQDFRGKKVKVEIDGKSYDAVIE